MRGPPPSGGFASRPGAAEDWIRAVNAPSVPLDRATNTFTARLTIDVTPALRRRLKFAAVTRGTTVADMIRGLLAREFPDLPGDPT